MSEPQRRAVFLDRDGVLNKTIIRDGIPCPPASAAEMIIPEDVPAALEVLKMNGFALICVTNQPDVARGKQSRRTVEQINSALLDALPLDQIRVCYHDDPDRCNCRKPLPGMLVDAASDLGIDLGSSFMVGDRWRDIEAGHRAGCRTILIDYQYDEDFAGRPPHFIAKSVIEAARWILEMNNQE